MGSSPPAATTKKPPPPPSSLTLFKPHRTKSCTECKETKFQPTVKPKTVVYYTTVTMIGHSTVTYVTAANIGSPARNGNAGVGVAGGSNGVRPGTIVGIVVACLAFLAIVAAVVAHYVRRNRSRSKSRLGPISAPVLQVEKYEGPARPRTPLTPREGSRDLPRISAYGTLRRSVGEEGDDAAENGNPATAASRPVRPSPLRKSVVYPDGYEGEGHANGSPESRYSQPDIPGSYYANVPTMPQPYEHTDAPPGSGGEGLYAAPAHEQYLHVPDPAALSPRYQLYPDPVDEEAQIGRRGGVATRSGSTFGPSTLMPPLREDTVLESRWSHSTSSAEQHDGVGRAR
ncbi:uncharacterized protein LOC62_04G005759 [Vanrija pseudolonga]|uniref:Uncharacterized protein n=1 Tax=Vanrija pseudolonga TaxID=143232 RepID=A0AAF0Y8P9_9TREE|nr:hypothetical protein LOC62_04G005759 [Vanrija pseudolonga]